MIFFLVASGSPSAVDAVAPRLADALVSCALLDATPELYVSPSRAWAVAAISVADPVVAGPRLLIDGDDMLVMNGSPFAVNGNQSFVTQNALGAFRARGSLGVADVVTGSFNFVGITREQGVGAAVDSSGLYPLYWASDGEAALFSNRSLAIAQALGRAGWDASAFAWILSHVNLVGEGLPAPGVRYVAPGFQARTAWATPGVSIERSPFWLWPGEDEGRENLTDREWDGVTEELVEHTRVIGAIDAPLSLGITGGKDSRLCLALARAADLSARVTAYNGGGPEVEHARRVAETAGFRFRKGRTPPEPGARTDAPSPSLMPAALPDGATRPGRWKQLCDNIARYEGIIGAWSALQNPTNASVEIKGWGGELFRRGNEKYFRSHDPTTIDELTATFIEQHRALDQLDLLSSATSEMQDEWISSWAHANAQHIPLSMLPEKFYVDFRLGHWSGPNIQCAPLSVTLNPLVCRPAAIKHLELSARARSSERFHYEVMRRAAPELVALPFYQDGWAPEIVASSPVPIPSRSQPNRRPPAWRRTAARLVKPIRRQPPPTVAQPRSTNPGWAFLDDDRAAIISVFHDAKHRTDMASICNLDRLIDLAQTSEPIRQLGAARQVTNAIGIALALLNTT